MNIAEEREIIDRVLSGDKDSFELLVTDNQKKVYNLALKMLGSEDDALDVSQEAFIKAYTYLPSFRSDSRFSVWLYRMTYNLCIDFLRKKSRENVVPLTRDDSSGDELELPVADDRACPEKLLEQKELSEAISDGLSQLSPEQREILILREISDLSYAEIASAMKIREGTVKSRIARARTRLAGILIKNGTFPPGYRHKIEKEVNGHD